MLKKKNTIAVAESVTSGLLQFAFSAMPDGAKFFEGGVTAYNLGQKSRQLNVNPISAIEVDCVSQAVANQMALHAAKLFTSNWSIGVTGYASPSRQSGQKLFAYYSIVYNGRVKARGKLNAKSGEPTTVQQYYATTILLRLQKLL